MKRVELQVPRPGPGGVLIPFIWSQLPTRQFAPLSCGRLQVSRPGPGGVIIPQALPFIWSQLPTRPLAPLSCGRLNVLRIIILFRFRKEMKWQNKFLKSCEMMSITNLAYEMANMKPFSFFQFLSAFYDSPQTPHPLPIGR